MGKIIVIALILTILVSSFPYILKFFERIYFSTFESGWLRGEKMKEEVVAKYIGGLKMEDSEIIKKLVPKTYEANKEIQEKIEIFKNSDFSKANVNFEPDGHLVQVRIKTLD